MTVKIADKLLNGVYGLSDPGRRVLGLIDGGLQWLDYALGEHQTHYQMRDESALVAAVQIGLHANRFILIDTLGLMVAPVKLMTMSGAELQTLQRAAIGELPPDEPRVVKLLTDHRLATQRDFAAVEDLLRNLEVWPAPMFQAMDLDDRLAVLELTTDPRMDPLHRNAWSPEMMIEAAGFAVTQACSPAEFVDYFLTYLDHIAALLARPDSPTVPKPDTQPERRERVQIAIYTLAPLMFPALDCPEVAGLVSPLEVEGAIIEWLMNGRQLGFLRVSQGVQQIVANTGFTDEDGVAAQLIVRGYLDRAQQLIRMHGITRGRLGQDGATCLFPIASAHEEAVIRLGASGVITLARFSRTHLLREPGERRPAAPRAPAHPPVRAPARAPTRAKIVRRRKGTNKK